MDSTQKTDSKFRYILVAAKRTRQLQAGARSQIQGGAGKKLTRLAQQEVAAGLVPFELLAPTTGEDDKNKKPKK